MTGPWTPLRLALTAVVVLGCAPVVLGTEDPDAKVISRRAETVLDHPSYQTELPGRLAPAGDGAGRDRAGTGGGNGRRRAAEARPRRRSEYPDRGRDSRPWGDGTSRPPPPPPVAGAAAGPVTTTVLWVLVAAAVALAAVWLIRETRRSRLRLLRMPEPQDGPEAPAPEPAPPTEDEIEALARAGSYGEAVHLLLRRSIEDLGEKRPLAPALTSREVLRSAGLPPSAHDAFAELVSAAERFWFGGAALSRQDYERCDAAYRTLAGTEGAA